MTEEQKQLLLKDLCGRLPYGVKVCPVFITSKKELPSKEIRELNALHLNSLKCDMNNGMQRYTYKPYLYPLSSMSEEQRNSFYEYSHIISVDFNFEGYKMLEEKYCYKAIDWLNAHHFDYCRLIEKGLAIDATGLNIYKEKTK